MPCGKFVLFAICQNYGTLDKYAPKYCKLENNTVIEIQFIYQHV